MFMKQPFAECTGREALSGCAVSGSVREPAMRQWCEGML